MNHSATEPYTRENFLSQVYLTEGNLDTLCGLLNAPSQRYQPYQDFASPSYAYNRENLTTMLGQRRLTEDMTDMQGQPLQQIDIQLSTP